MLKFNPSWVHISAEGARVEFGGGFHHFGYGLVPASPPSKDDSGTVWVFSFYSEDSAGRELGRFTLAAKDGLTEAEFVDRAMAEFDRRIAKPDAPIVVDRASVERCAFAMKHNQVVRLRDAIRETSRKNVNAWRDVLLTFAMDYPTDQKGAAERLRAWANAKGDFSAWLMAAYAFDKVGDADAVEDAALRACGFPADDPGWASMHARARGYSMCCRLYTGGKYNACVNLCETLLAYGGAGEHMASSILAIRKAAGAAQTSGTPDPLPAIETGRPNVFDPFEGIDLDVLRASGGP